MRILSLLMLLVIAGCTGCAQATPPDPPVPLAVPTMDEMQATTARLDFEGGGVCSCNATGPAKLRTAQHCMDMGKLLRVNGVAVEVLATKREAPDRTTVYLTKPIFRTWARISATRPSVGDRVRYWGNPKLMANVYRVGYVAKVGYDFLVIDANLCHGDSGAGLFNDVGELVGVVSMMMPEQVPCAFMESQ